MTGFSKIKFGEGLTVSDEGGGIILVSATPGGGATAAGFVAAILADTPEMWLRMREAAGATTMADSSGNGHYADIASSNILSFQQDSPIPDGYSIGYHASSAHDWAVGQLAGADYTDTDDYSLEAWVKAPSASFTAAHPVVDTQSAGGFGLQLTGTPGFRFYVKDGTYVQAGVPGAADIWVYVVGVKEGSELRIYIDGVLANNAIEATTWTPGTAMNVYVGHKGRGGTLEYFTGQMTEVAVYKRALTGDEIAAHYEAATGSPPGGTLAEHLAAADPHPQYQLESEKNQNSGYAGLDSGGKVAAAQLGSVDRLSDVDTTTAAPTSGQALIWDSGTSQWKPGTAASLMKVAKAGTLVGTRGRINFIEGTNITITAADDAGSDEIDVTIAASLGGSGNLITLFDSTLGADASSIDTGSGGFSTAYAHLLVELYLRTDAATTATTAQIRFNNDSGSNYSSHFIQVNSTTSSGGANSTAASSADTCLAAGANAAANRFGVGTLHIPHYAGSGIKSWSCHSSVFGDSSGINVGGDHYTRLYGGIWASTSAISRITMLPSGSNFKAGSRLTVYAMGVS